MFKSALKADNEDIFRSRVRAAIAHYERVCQTKSSIRVGRFYQNLATSRYLQYWNTQMPAEKRRALREAWSSAKRAMRHFEQERHFDDFARTFNQNATRLALLVQYESSFSNRVRMTKDAVELGRRVIRSYRTALEKIEIARTLAKTALLLDDFVEYLADPSKGKECDREAIGYWKRAIRISKKVVLEAISAPTAGPHRIVDGDEALKIQKEGLRLALKSGDNFRIGWLCDQISKKLFWKAMAGGDLPVRVRVARDSLKFAEKAAKYYARIDFTSPSDGVLWAHCPYVEHFLQLSWFELHPDKKRRLLEKGVALATELKHLASKSRYPGIISYSYSLTARCRGELADLEPNPATRRRLLHEALRERTKAIALERFAPRNTWNYGATVRYLADIVANLSALKQKPIERRRFLLKAIEIKHSGLEACTTWVQSLDKSSSHTLRAPLSKYWWEYGNLLDRLYRMTGEKARLRAAASAYVQAASWCENTRSIRGQAYCYWSAGQAFEKLGSHSTASENFAKASKAYLESSRALPSLKEHYKELSVFLDAWNRIEDARQHHTRFEFESASKLYEGAADLHKSTRNWSYLEPYYEAWAKLELAENHSRNGDSQNAIRMLQQALSLFENAKASLRMKLPFIEDSEENKVATRLVNSPREDYCRGRILLEEARLAENEGDYSASLEKCRLATDRFKDFKKLSDSDEDTKEAELLVTQSCAWQLTAQAEIENSDLPLRQAASLFEKAKEISPDTNGRILSTAHMEFCRGLLYARRYAETFNTDSYSTAQRKLDAALSHYQATGSTTAAEHASAQKLLLDALRQLDNGNRSSDPDVKSQSWTAAEILLRDAADKLERAQQLARRKQVLRLLDRTREDWEEASHLAEFSRAASTMSSNIVLRGPAHGVEAPAGLEQFERTHVNAQVRLKSSAPWASGSIELEIGIVNDGNHLVRLERINDVVAEGSEIVSSTWGSSRQGRSLMLDDKPLSPGAAETIGITLRPQRQGLLTISPRLIYRDEKNILHQHVLSREVIPTSSIIEHLAQAYVHDYSKRHLMHDQCGWRTLMDIAKSTKIPRSHLYGESRFGRKTGRPLEFLLNASLVESKVFPGERGRGGEIRKVRVSYENESIKKYVDGLVL